VSLFNTIFCHQSKLVLSSLGLLNLKEKASNFICDIRSGALVTGWLHLKPEALAVESATQLTFNLAIDVSSVDKAFNP